MSVFLNSKNKIEIYIEQPEDFLKKGRNISKSFSKPYIKLYKRYITEPKTLTTHMKATDIISHMQIYRFDHEKLMINSQLP